MTLKSNKSRSIKKVNFKEKFSKFSEHWQPKVIANLNDYEIMDYVGYSVAPIDAHKIILNKADLVIQKKGGEGFVRDFVEKLLLENGLIYHEIIKMIR